MLKKQPLSSGWVSAGATFGLYTAVTGVKLAGQATAVAEGNALGKGALVYHLFPSALQTIQDNASGGSYAACCINSIVY